MYGGDIAKLVRTQSSPIGVGSDVLEWDGRERRGEVGGGGGGGGGVGKGG